MEKVKCLIWCPIRDNASMREGLVRALGVKVKRVRAKRSAVVRSQNSEDVRRKAHIDVVSS